MAVCCISLISWFPALLLWYCPNDFEMVPVAPCYYSYHFCLHMPHAMNFCYEVFVFYNRIAFFLDHTSVLLLLLYKSLRSVYHHFLPGLVVAELPNPALDPICSIYILYYFHIFL